MLDFTKFFVLEYDTSGKGLGEVLMKEGCPLEFTSNQLCGRNFGKFTYEKEMMAILMQSILGYHISLGSISKLRWDNNFCHYRSTSGPIR
jgi:hypothetical protein